MILWRISRHRDLSGAGGLRVPGRWHHAGLPIVYLAGSPAAALLEVCVHTSANDVPPEFTLLKIDGPDVEFAGIRAEDLPRDWRSSPETTRGVGAAWLRKKNAVLLEVPSAIVPETGNFLFNPLHGDAARFRITDVFAYPFDIRRKM
ncbi:MAG: RES family NAD+ phosphorylase [Bryobacteraceae bacterium]|jgi:RES domain-containing protein